MQLPLTWKQCQEPQKTSNGQASRLQKLHVYNNDKHCPRAYQTQLVTDEHSELTHSTCCKGQVDPYTRILSANMAAKLQILSSRIPTNLLTRDQFIQRPVAAKITRPVEVAYFWPNTTSHLSCKRERFSHPSNQLVDAHCDCIPIQGETLFTNPKGANSQQSPFHRRT